MKGFIFDALNNSFIFLHNMVIFMILTYFASKYNSLFEIISFGICIFIINIKISVLASSFNDMIGIFFLKAYSNKDKRLASIIFIQTIGLGIFLTILLIILYLNIHNIFKLLNYDTYILIIIKSFFKIIIIGLFFNIMNIIFQCLLVNLRKLYINILINSISFLLVYILLKLNIYYNDELSWINIAKVKVINDFFFFIWNITYLLKQRKIIFNEINFYEIKLDLGDKLIYFVKRFLGCLKNKLSIQIILYVFNMRNIINEKESFNLLINLCNFYSFYLLFFFIAFRMRVFYNLGKNKFEKAREHFKEIKIIILINLITVILFFIFKKQLLFLFLSKNTKFKIIKEAYFIIITKFLFYCFRYYIQMMLRIARLDNHYLVWSFLNLFFCSFLSIYGYKMNFSINYFISLLFVEEFLMIIFLIFYYKEFKWENVIKKELKYKRKLEKENEKLNLNL